MQPAAKHTMSLPAPIERVWQAITDPKEIQQWFSPTTPWAVTTLQPGGKIYAIGYESEAGVIQRVEAPHTFEYRWDSMPPADPLTTVTTYELREDGENTRVTFTETVSSDTIPEAERQKRITDTEDGYKKAFKNLEAYLTRQDLPFPEGL